MRTVRVSAAVTALAGVLVLGVVVAPSVATVEELDGLIAYPIGGGEDPYVIRTVKPDGTHNRRLIGPRRGLFRLGPSSPEWSADGRKLLFGGHTAAIRRPGRCGTRRPRASESGESGSVSAALVAVPTRSSSMVGTGLRTAGGWCSRRVRGWRQRGCTRSRFMDGTAEHWVAAGGRSGPATAATSCSASAPEPCAPRQIGVVRPNGNGSRLTDSTQDWFPRFSPDGQRVVFVRNIGIFDEWRMVDVTGQHDVVVGPIAHRTSAIAARNGRPTARALRSSGSNRKPTDPGHRQVRDHGHDRRTRPRGLHIPPRLLRVANHLRFLMATAVNGQRLGQHVRPLLHVPRRAPAAEPWIAALLLRGVAVAYIGGGSKWSVSRRLICRGALPESLRTAHFASRSEAARRRRTYATASGRRDSASVRPATVASRAERHSVSARRDCSWQAQAIARRSDVPQDVGVPWERSAHGYCLLAASAAHHAERVISPPAPTPAPATITPFG